MRLALNRGGYSLLEIMIALAVMALAAALVLPGLSVGLGSAARHAAAMELDQQLLSLRRAAQRDGVARVLGASSDSDDQNLIAAELALPNGWNYEIEQPLVFAPDGGCDEGVITLVKENAARVRFVIRMPGCRPRLA